VTDAPAAESPFEAPLRHLERPDGARIAYRHTPGAGPTVVFLCGYASDMSGSKALHLERCCRERGQAFLRLDYRGHGESSGRFEEGTIGAWAEDARSVIEACTEGPLLLVGSSMGGWIMLLVALAMPERVAGLVGVAAAPDFTEELVWEALDEAARAELLRAGRLLVPSEYDEEPCPFTLALIEEARSHLLLRAPIPLACPVRLLQGLADPDVPWETALRLAERLAAEDVRVTLVKGAGHRLSEPEHLELLDEAVRELSGGARRS